MSWRHASEASAPGRLRGSGASRSRWRTGPGLRGGAAIEAQAQGRLHQLRWTGGGAAPVSNTQELPPEPLILARIE
jgi:hypothetical protein